MICPHCELDTAPTAPTCEHCGGRLDVIFEEIDQELREQDAERETTRALEAARSWLLLALVLLGVAIAGRLALVRRAEVALVEPAYEVRATEEPAVVDLEVPVPPIELPASGAAPGGGGG